MITPELKSLTSTDLARAELPSDPEICSVTMDAEIGPKGEIGSERFSFSVVTPKHLLQEPLPRWGRGYLIVDSFSWATAEQAVQKLLEHSRRNSWQEVVDLLGQDLNSEFQNYRPFSA